MPGKITRIAVAIALLLYPVGANEAHTLNVFPTGESFGAAQTQRLQAAATPVNATQSAPAAAPRESGVVAEGQRRSRKAKTAGTKTGRGKRRRAGRAPTARWQNAGFAGVEKRRRHLATQYYNHAGQPLVFTSGYRTPADQARAIYNNMRRHGVAYVIGVYRRKAAIREIVAAYRPRRRHPRRAIAAMTRVIEAQTERGVFISRHLVGRAFDVRSRGRNGARLPILREVAQGMGGRVLVARNHYHVEL